MFRRYKYFRNIFRLGYFVSFIILLLLAFLTYYGQYSGNFVMTVDERSYDRGIAISEHTEFDTYQRWLAADAVEDVREITLEMIELYDLGRLLETDGSFKDSRLGAQSNKKLNYLAYTFYVINIGEESFPLYYQVVISNQTNDLSDAIRIMVIEDGYVDHTDETNKIVTFSDLSENSYKLYQLEDTKPHQYTGLLAKSKNFVNNSIVCNEVVENFKPLQIKKFTILLWLEGEDPDCSPETTQKLYGSKIKIAMNLSVDSFA